MKILIVISFLILTVHGQSTNWKEGELNPPENGDGYGIMESKARSLDTDEPEYQDLQSEESEESVESLEESTEVSESLESFEESSEESMENYLEVKVEEMKEPEVGIIGKTLFEFWCQNLFYF